MIMNSTRCQDHYDAINRRLRTLEVIQTKYLQRQAAFDVIVAQCEEREAVFAAIAAQHRQQRDSFVVMIANQQAAQAAAVDLPTSASASDHHSPVNPVEASKDSTPPMWATYLIYLLLPREDREAMLGCLEEDYRTKLLPKYGVHRARFWYWCEVGRSIWPLLAEVFSRILSWLIQKNSS